MNRLLNIYTIIGFILFINLGTLAVLRFGNPQWSKHIYIFQCYYLPQYKNGWIEKPEKYTGKWFLWYKSGQLRSSGNYIGGARDGKFQTWHENGEKIMEVDYKMGKELRFKIFSKP